MKRHERGEIVTLITLGTVVVLGVASIISSVFLTNTKQTIKSKAEGTCADQHLCTIKDTGECGQSCDNLSKCDIAGGCNPACCVANSDCAANQQCNISNGYCGGSTSGNGDGSTGKSCNDVAPTLTPTPSTGPPPTTPPDPCGAKGGTYYQECCAKGYERHVCNVSGTYYCDDGSGTFNNICDTSNGPDGWSCRFEKSSCGGADKSTCKTETDGQCRISCQSNETLDTTHKCADATYNKCCLPGASPTTSPPPGGGSPSTSPPPNGNVCNSYVLQICFDAAANAAGGCDHWAPAGTSVMVGTVKNKTGGNYGLVSFSSPPLNKGWSYPATIYSPAKNAGVNFSLNDSCGALLFANIYSGGGGGSTCNKFGTCAGSTKDIYQKDSKYYIGACSSTDTKTYDSFAQACIGAGVAQLCGLCVNNSTACRPSVGTISSDPLDNQYCKDNFGPSSSYFTTAVCCKETTSTPCTNGDTKCSDGVLDTCADGKWGNLSSCVSRKCDTAGKTCLSPNTTQCESPITKTPFTDTYCETQADSTGQVYRCLQGMGGAMEGIRSCPSGCNSAHTDCADTPSTAPAQITVYDARTPFDVVVNVRRPNLDQITSTLISKIQNDTILREVIFNVIQCSFNLKFMKAEVLTYLESDNGWLDRTEITSKRIDITSKETTTVTMPGIKGDGKDSIIRDYNSLNVAMDAYCPNNQSQHVPITFYSILGSNYGSDFNDITQRLWSGGKHDVNITIQTGDIAGSLPHPY